METIYTLIAPLVLSAIFLSAAGWLSVFVQFIPIRWWNVDQSQPTLVDQVGEPSTQAGLVRSDVDRVRSPGSITSTTALSDNDDPEHHSQSTPSATEVVPPKADTTHLQNSVPWPLYKKDDGAGSNIPTKRRSVAISQASEPRSPGITQSLLSATDDVQLHRGKTTTHRGATLSTATSRRSFRLPSSITKHSPLETGLHTGSSNLHSALSCLVIAYGHEGTKWEIGDPTHDTNYLYDALGDVEGVTFQSLLGSEATLTMIDSNVIFFWDSAAPGTHILLLLTGHGFDNTMELYGGERIDESYINNLIKNLPLKDLQVIVIFDICRDNKEKVATNMDDRVALIWSCSPGQQASALKFTSFHMPSSFLLIGLFMASWDVSQNFEHTFEHHLGLRVTQLSRFNNHIHHRGECETCLPDQGCLEAFEMREQYAQDIDLNQAQGAMGKLHQLLIQQPRFVELAENIAAFMLKNKPFLRSNGLPLPEHLIRGANDPVSQVSTGSTVE